MSIPTASLYPAALDTIVSLFAAPMDQFSTTLAVGIDNQPTTTAFQVVDSIAGIAVPTYMAFNTGEIVYIEAKTDGTKTFSTVTRSASPQSHLAGEVIRQVLTANYINQIRKAIIAIETELGTTPKSTYGSVAAAITDFIALKASKHAASGLASLDGNSKVVENPASSQTTAASGKIPISDGSGKLDTWVSAMTTSVVGMVQAATAAETTAGSLATKAVTPNGLKGSVVGERILTFCMNGLDTLSASNKAKFKVPASMNGMVLVSCTFNLGIDGSSGSSSSGAVTFSVQKGTTDMLTTNPSATANNYSPTTAAVIKSGGSIADATVATGDIIIIEVVSAGTGVTYSVITLEFQLP